MAVIVETQELLRTVIASVVAGVGVTVIFSIAIWGAVRFSDFSRDERPIAAVSAAAVCALALAATLGAVVVGLIVMTGK